MQSSRNQTRWGYGSLATIGRTVRMLGATTLDKLASAACNSNNIELNCLDQLLMAVLPDSYNSNTTQDTGGLQLISPAQVRPKYELYLSLTLQCQSSWLFVAPCPHARGTCCKMLLCELNFLGNMHLLSHTTSASSWWCLASNIQCFAFVQHGCGLRSLAVLRDGHT
jgi:hypothetical protein